MKKIHIMLCLALGILVSGCFTSYVSTKQMMGIYQGMTQSQVESVLGKPDFRRGWLRCAAAKENAGGQQRRRHDDDRLIAGDVQAVHDLFEDQRHRDVGELGGDQAAEGEHHPPLPGPQVGQQLLDGLPVVAFAAGGSGRRTGGGASHRGNGGLRPGAGPAGRLDYGAVAF